MTQPIHRLTATLALAIVLAMPARATAPEWSTARLSFVGDNCTLEAVVQEIARSYGVPVVLVLREVDLDDRRPARKTFHAWQVEYPAFFAQLVAAFPSYVCHTSRTGVCVIMPADLQDEENLLFTQMTRSRVTTGTAEDVVRSCLAEQEFAHELPSFERWQALRHEARFPFRCSQPRTRSEPALEISLQPSTFPLWEWLAAAVAASPRSYLMLYTAHDDSLSNPQESDGPLHGFWSLGNSIDYLDQDMEVLGKLPKRLAPPHDERRPSAEYQDLIRQASRMGSQRLLAFYNQVAEEDMDTRFFAPIICSPLAIHKDAAISIAADHVANEETALSSMTVLLSNTWSEDVVAYLSSIIAVAPASWQAKVYPFVEYAPTYVSEDTLQAWKAALEDGYGLMLQSRAERWADSPKASVGNELDDNQREALRHHVISSWDEQLKSPQRQQRIEQARETRTQRIQAKLALMQIDTSRSLRHLLVPAHE